MMWPIADNDPNDRNRQRFRHRSGRDVRLAYLIVEELVADPRVSYQPIGVEVQNGVVVLTGTVDTPETRELVGDTVRHVDGVIDICNELRVPALSERPAGSGSSHRHDQQYTDQLFQEIVAGLATPDRSPATAGSAVRRFRPLLLLLALVLSGLLAGFLLWRGWVGFVLVVGVGTVIATQVLRHTVSRADRW